MAKKKRNMFTSHSKPMALSLTHGGLTSIYVRVSIAVYTYANATWPAAAAAAKRNGLTLVDLVRPLTFHSSISAGASTDVTFAASINGSLMMLTVNCFVASIFSLVSLDFCGV